MTTVDDNDDRWREIAEADDHNAGFDLALEELADAVKASTDAVLGPVKDPRLGSFRRSKRKRQSFIAWRKMKNLTSCHPMVGQAERCIIGTPPDDTIEFAHQYCAYIAGSIQGTERPLSVVISRLVTKCPHTLSGEDDPERPFKVELNKHRCFAPRILPKVEHPRDLDNPEKTYAAR